MDSEMKCDLILVAGGSGARFNSLKQFEEIQGKPTYLWFLETFFSWDHCGSAIVVVPEVWQVEVETQVKKFSSIQIARGGPSRQASATNGFEKLQKFSHNPWVMVHDAARPCASAELLNRLWEARVENTNSKVAGVIPGLPVRETIKEVKNAGSEKPLMVAATPRRESLYAIQTPQLFKAEILGQAYKKFSGSDAPAAESMNAPDDASLVEKLGHEVIVVPGEYDNLKITFREDLDRVSNRLRK